MQVHNGFRYREKTARALGFVQQRDDADADDVEHLKRTAKPPKDKAVRPAATAARARKDES